MTNEYGTARLTSPVGDRDHVQGPADAPVTPVEYGDFECPYCGEAYPIVKELQGLLGDRLCFVFRHFPLAQVHPHAQHAAEAAEAAAAQRRFWEMHDTLFEHQRALGDGQLVAYAGRVGLDIDRFVAQLARGTYAGRVREDFLGGARSGVNGTRHDGGYDLGDLLRAVEGAAQAVRPAAIGGA